MALTNKTITLIVPALNEEKNLPLLLEKSIEVLPKYFSQYEIIIVDDGSQDQTSEIVTQWSKKNSAVKLIRHPVNLGVGSCIRDAFKIAKFDWLFQIPGDNQFNIEEIGQFVPQLDSADIIQGWRTNLSYSCRRKIVTWIYRALLRLLFGLNLRDATWVKMMRADMVKNLPIATEGFFGEIEIIVRAKKKGARFCEVGVSTQKRLHGFSYANNVFRIIKTFFELVVFKIKLTAKPQNRD